MTLSRYNAYINGQNTTMTTIYESSDDANSYPSKSINECVWMVPGTETDD